MSSGNGLCVADCYETYFKKQKSEFLHYIHAMRGELDIMKTADIIASSPVTYICMAEIWPEQFEEQNDRMTLRICNESRKKFVVGACYDISKKHPMKDWIGHVIVLAFDDKTVTVRIDPPSAFHDVKRRIVEEIIKPLCPAKGSVANEMAMRLRFDESIAGDITCNYVIQTLRRKIMCVHDPPVLIQMIVDSRLTGGEIINGNKLLTEPDEEKRYESFWGELNDKQRGAFKMSNDHRITCIQGGPGTGKTLLAENMQKAHVRLNKRVIVGCPNNDGVDHLFLLMCKNLDNTRCVHLGKVDSNQQGEAVCRYSFESWCSGQDKKKYCEEHFGNLSYVGGVLNEFGNPLLGDVKAVKDVLIVEDACRAYEAQTVIPITHLHKFGRVILIGDSHQSLLSGDPTCTEESPYFLSLQ